MEKITVTSITFFANFFQLPLSVHVIFSKDSPVYFKYDASQTAYRLVLMRSIHYSKLCCDDAHTANGLVFMHSMHNSKLFCDDAQTANGLVLAQYA